MTKTSAPQTIKPQEAAHFGALAADWWDPKGTSAMLHKLNPVRLGFIRNAVDQHFGSDRAGLKPLAGRTALDAGCGAGLLCEPLARLGAAVTGVDAAPENIEAAKAHAAQAGLAIDYRSGELAAQGLRQFDLVTSMEVIEHVADPAAFVAELARHLKPDGLMILSTPNRTMASRLFLVEAAERLGQVPRGTHDWDQFLTPEELEALLNAAGLEVVEMRGIAVSPLKGLHLSENKALNYILAARFRN
jgi:2-polyprenyl-6-hydroxyphenyl methylase / 3-demethylubiquinone-9 3-methyltransferase